MIDTGIPALRSDRLATVIPTRVYAGGPVESPAETLFLWRSMGTERAQGATLAFYLSDDRLEALWRHPARYAKQFKSCGIKAAVEVDFSLWVDRSLTEQAHNVCRTRTVSRVFQSAGLLVIPNLNWSDERSFSFCFSGIPQHAPVCMTECRTPGGTDEDRRRFLAGLTEAVKHVQPQHVVIYGGTSHAYWLTGHLPQGPVYHLIDSWTSARGKIRKAQEREVRAKNQLTFGGEQWADEAQVAA